MTITEAPLPEPSAFDFEMVIEKLHEHNQIAAEFIKQGATTFRSEIHKYINSIWNKKELSEEWTESVIVLIYKKRDETDCSIYR